MKNVMIDYYLKDNFNSEDIRETCLDSKTVKITFVRDNSNMLIKLNDKSLIEVYIDNKLFHTYDMFFDNKLLKREWKIVK